MRAVRQRYPQVRLQLFESMSGYISELLNQNRLDFAILFRDTASRAVEPEPLASEPLYLIGTPPGRATRSATIALKALDGMPLVLPSGSQGLREVVERSFAKAGIALNVVADLDSLPFLLAAAREGLACTVLPASSLGESPGAEGMGMGLAMPRGHRASPDPAGAAPHAVPVLAARAAAFECGRGRRRHPAGDRLQRASPRAAPWRRRPPLRHLPADKKSLWP